MGDTSTVLLAGFTLISIIAARYGAILLHEWSHSTLAWLFGLFPGCPLDIHYGDWTLLGANALEFSHMSETAYYSSLMQQGLNLKVAAISMAGPCMNLLLAFLCFALLWQGFLKNRPFTATFVLWFLVFNLGAVWGFALLRVFSVHSDFGFFEAATGFPALGIFIPAAIFAIAAAVLLFLSVLPRYYEQAGITGTRKKMAVIILVFLVMWLYYTVLPSGIMENNAGTVNGIMAIVGTIVLIACSATAGRKLLYTG